MPARKTLADYEAEAKRKGACLLHPTKYASRRVYQLRHGRLRSPRVQVCHSCDNRYCIEDSHHFLGSQLDNMKDMAAKGRGINQNLSPELLARRGASVSKALKAKGLKLSEAHKRAISAANKGKKLSEAHIDSLRARMLGPDNPVKKGFTRGNKKT